MSARPRAVLAFAMTIIVLASGLLARHHAADVAHVADQSGTTSHAIATECHDSAPIVHIHELPGDDHADVCSALAALHQPVVFTRPVLLVGELSIALHASAPPVAPDHRASLLLSAPKTSPPVARG